MDNWIAGESLQIGTVLYGDKRTGKVRPWRSEDIGMPVGMASRNYAEGQAVNPIEHGTFVTADSWSLADTATPLAKMLEVQRFAREHSRPLGDL